MRERALAAVIGDPVEHSLSPEIFSILSRHAKFPVEYRKIRIPAKNLKETFRSVAVLSSFRGWNVTLPHKQSIARLVTRLSPEAQALGAVNVVVFQGKGGEVGVNSDVLGFADALKMKGFRSKRKKAVIVGAGGAALAAGYVLGRQGAALVNFKNRDLKRAQAVTKKLGKLYPGTQFRCCVELPPDADLYVNATPLGMKGFPRSPRLPLLTAKSPLVFDLIYRPNPTEWMLQAEKQGVECLSGLEMLIGQAIATWEVWFGKLPAKQRARAQLRKRLLLLSRKAKQ